MSMSHGVSDGGVLSFNGVAIVLCVGGGCPGGGAIRMLLSGGSALCSISVSNTSRRLRVLVDVTPPMFYFFRCVFLDVCVCDGNTYINKTPIWINVPYQNYQFSFASSGRKPALVHIIVCTDLQRVPSLNLYPTRQHGSSINMTRFCNCRVDTGVICAF